MQRQPDLFDLFRNNQHKLTQRPSPHAWRRLERRLDRNSGVKRFSLLRQWSLAAAIVLLVGVVFLVTLMVDRRETHLAARDTQPVELEDLNPRDGDLALLRQVTFAHQHQLGTTIQEGKGANRLVPRTPREN